MIELHPEDKYPIEAENDTVQMEFDTRGNHRLVLKSDPKVKTTWAPYSSYTYLAGFVGCSAYYTGGNQGQILSPEEFVKMTAHQQVES